VKRFNKFLSANAEAFSDLKMWEWIKEDGERKRSKNNAPSPIKWNRQAVLRQSPFIFLGRLRLDNEIDYELILSDFDRLLPLYEFVESDWDLVRDNRILEDVAGFEFEPREVNKATHAAAIITGKRLQVELRENKLQAALRYHLTSIYGAENVSPEQRLSTMRGYLYRTDITVRRGKDYWFYEAKIGPTVRQCIRKALGQLLEYSFWPGHPEASKLIVIGEPPLSAEARHYLTRLKRKFSLPIEYQQFDMKKGKLIEDNKG
jgi:hypothetical protein